MLILYEAGDMVEDLFGGGIAICYCNTNYGELFLNTECEDILVARSLKPILEVGNA